MNEDFVIGICFGVMIFSAVLGIAEFTSNYEIVKIVTE